MSELLPPSPGFTAVATFETDAVQARGRGFVLEATGRDGVDYIMHLSLDLPMDPRTRNVLAEMLSQSACALWRRRRPPLRRTARQPSNHHASP